MNRSTTNTTSVLTRRVPETESSARPIGEADEILNCFFSDTIGLLCLASFDGFFTRLTPAWESTLGWSLEELKSRPFIELVHPDDHAGTLFELKRLGSGGRTIQFKNRYRCRDGSYKWLQWNATSLSSQRKISASARDLSGDHELERQAVDAADREKERLGRELHDGICQHLAGIAALSTTLSRRLAANGVSDSDSDSDSAAAAEIPALLNESIGQIRDMSRGLNPANLERIGIAAALETFAESVRPHFQVDCTFRCQRPDVRPGPAIEGHLFRITQEAVHNAITHGRGSWIEIILDFQIGESSLTVRDDGIGISRRKSPEAGIGLDTMKQRARLIGGTLELRPRSPQGTSVICRFPLSEYQ